LDFSDELTAKVRGIQLKDWKALSPRYILGKPSEELEELDEKEKESLKKKVEKYENDVKAGKRDPPLTEIIFGPTTDAASEHAGAVSVGDARVLLFPVRSARGVFAYATSPLVLKRLMEDLRLVAGGKGIVKVNVKKENGGTHEKITLSELENIVQEITGKLSSTDGREAKAIVFGDTLVLDNDDEGDDGRKVILEELILSAEKLDESSSAKNSTPELPEILSKLFPELLSRDELKERLVVVPDDVFTSLVELTTEVVARVRINAETGTVEKGGLWYEEFLPRDALMYSLIVVSEPKVSMDKLPPELGAEPVEKIAGILGDVFNGSYLQIGGDETVGKGFTKVSAVCLEGGEGR